MSLYYLNPDRVVAFWDFVEKTPHCWFWIGAKRRRGYGNFWDGRRMVSAHGFSWEITHRKAVPAGLEVMHSCDHPSCVRPDHLSVGTRSDNMRDASTKGRLNTRNAVAAIRAKAAARTHCKRGHELTAASLDANGIRRCQQCRRATQRRWARENYVPALSR